MTFVKDTCAGFEEIYKSDSLFGEVTNIGMNSEISIGDLAKQIAQLMNIDLKINTDKERIRPENSEVERLVCNNEKLVKASLWEAKYDLKKGLSETIAWFKKNGGRVKSELYHV